MLRTWASALLRLAHFPNYDERSIAEAVQQLRNAGLPATLVGDCSHVNSGKQHPR